MVRPLTGYVYSGIWQSSDHSGSIMIEFDPEGAVSMFHYFIIPNEYVKHVEIISEEAAYSELMAVILNSIRLLKRAAKL